METWSKKWEDCKDANNRSCKMDMELKMNLYFEKNE
jgi:hypothetical protein